MKTRKGRAASTAGNAAQGSLFDAPDDAAQPVAEAEQLDKAPRPKPARQASPASPDSLGADTSAERSAKTVVRAALSEPRTPQGLAAPLEAQFDALPSAWREHLRTFIDSHAYRPLCAYVDEQITSGKTVYPADVFRALRLTHPDDVKVVIVGQDPYHGDDKGHPQAHGLAFSVPSPVRPPPSLRNIFKEIAAEFGYVMPAHGCLDAWARQGVLLLNTVLTVEQAKAASHAKHGWEACTDTLIRQLAARHEHLVFMLWGAHAQAKRALLDTRPHCVLEAPHPSPLSAHRGFLGCRHFALANDYLAANDRARIDWRLPETADR